MQRSHTPTCRYGVGAPLRGVPREPTGAVRKLITELAGTARLDLLRFLERVQLQDLQHARDWIAIEEQLIATQAARRPPPPPDWLIEHGIGTGRPPVRVHTGGAPSSRGN